VTSLSPPFSFSQRGRLLSFPPSGNGALFFRGFTQSLPLLLPLFLFFFFSLRARVVLLSTARGRLFFRAFVRQVDSSPARVPSPFLPPLFFLRHARHFGARQRSPSPTGRPAGSGQTVFAFFSLFFPPPRWFWGSLQPAPPLQIPWISLRPHSDPTLSFFFSCPTRHPPFRPRGPTRPPTI